MQFRTLQRLLLPVRCVFCGVRCHLHEASICDHCLADLPWHAELCDTPHAPLDCVAAPLAYAFPVDAALKALKFRRRLEYVPCLGSLLRHSLAQLPDDIDALLPMPLHWRRQAMRGFNQAWELSKPIRKHTGLPLLAGVRRVRATSFQSGLDAAARKRNLHNAFAVEKPVQALHVLIVDDVITTGESCRQLAKTLLKAGAEKVSALAVART